MSKELVFALALFFLGFIIGMNFKGTLDHLDGPTQVWEVKTADIGGLPVIVRLNRNTGETHVSIIGAEPGEWHVVPEKE